MWGHHTYLSAFFRCFTVLIKTTESGRWCLTAKSLVVAIQLGRIGQSSVSPIKSELVTKKGTHLFFHVPRIWGTTYTKLSVIISARFKSLPYP